MWLKDKLERRFLTQEKDCDVRHLEFYCYPLSSLNAVTSHRCRVPLLYSVRYHDNWYSTFKMAAYIATHDRSVLSKPHEDTKVSVTQNATHKDILGKFFCRKCCKIKHLLLLGSRHQVNLSMFTWCPCHDQAHIITSCFCFYHSDLQQSMDWLS